MDKKRIELLAELIAELGQGGREAAVALRRELNTYPDMTDIDEGLEWLADLPTD